MEKVPMFSGGGFFAVGAGPVGGLVRIYLLLTWKNAVGSPVAFGIGAVFVASRAKSHPTENVRPARRTS
jgi:hypothetical protein